MAIMGSWSRFLSRSADSTLPDGPFASDEPPSPPNGLSLEKQQSSASSSSKLKKTLSWVSNSRESSSGNKSPKSSGSRTPVSETDVPTSALPRTKKTKENKRRPIYTHPSQRPLTETNLRHQEMLSKFSWSPDAPSTPRRLSYYSTVSPTSSPRGSFEVVEARPVYD